MAFHVVGVPSPSFTHGSLALSGTVAARRDALEMSRTTVAIRGGVCKASVRGGALTMSGTAAARGGVAAVLGGAFALSSAAVARGDGVMVGKAAARGGDLDREKNNFHEFVKTIAQKTVDMWKSIRIEFPELHLEEMFGRRLLKDIEGGLVGDKEAAKKLMGFHVHACKILRLRSTRASLQISFNTPKVTLVEFVKILAQTILYALAWIETKPFPVTELEWRCEELLLAIEKGHVHDEKAAEELMRLHAHASRIFRLHGGGGGGSVDDDDVLKPEESTRASLQISFDNFIKEAIETKERMKKLGK